MVTMPDNFDLDALLAPCAGETAAGIDLREDFSPQSPYYKLRDARASARTAERQLDAGVAEGSDPPNPAPFWRSVRDLGTQVLAERSKDLEVAAWVTESLVRTDGLTGLAAGATLIARLTEAFWDADIFPRPDEDGMETRVAPVTGLNGQGGDGTLVQPLRLLTLCRGIDGEPIPFYRYADAELVAGLANSADRNAKYDRGSLKLDDVEKACRAAGTAHFGRLLAQLDGASEAWRTMGEVLDAKAGRDSPSTSAIRDLLTRIRDVVVRYAPAETGEAPVEAAAGSAPGPGAPLAAAVAGGGGEAPARVTREDMLRELSRIAAWFRGSEPQSPLSYTLDEAVRRGRMSWPDLLAEVVSDSSTRHAILGTLGIKPPEE